MLHATEGGIEKIKASAGNHEASPQKLLFHYVSTIIREFPDCYRDKLQTSSKLFLQDDHMMCYAGFDCLQGQSNKILNGLQRIIDHFLPLIAERSVEV